MTKHKSKYERNRIKRSVSKTDTPIQITESEKLLFREDTDEPTVNLESKILNDDCTLEAKTDACGDVLISIWKQFPEMHKYIRETLYCVIQNTIKNKCKWR
ncbi:MAG: hypothetical protein MUO82_03565 [Candidatus Thermoplasmatota archaeon]|nr:hypothetical protein [Candidatus Thermoplasmatota archaeon]